MAVRMIKITSVLLLFALLAGIVPGCGYSRPWYSDNTAASPSSTAQTSPPHTHVYTTEPTASQPTEPAPEPLPPGTGHINQESASQKPARPEPALPKLSARDYFIYDTRLGDFLYISGQQSDAIYPASTTKLFTAWVALQYLAPDEIVTVGSELSYVASDASIAGFRRGDKVSAEALVYAALLPSGCDASYILAAAAGRVLLQQPNAKAKAAIAAFMDECNRLGQELGMENTHFVTPDGYHHKDHKISLQAFAIIGKCSLENKLIAKAAATPEITISYTASSGKQVKLRFQNTNQTIQPDSKYYNELSVGLKTGSTGSAGYCLLTAYQMDGRYVLVGIFGCKSQSQRFADANKLLNAYLPYL